MTRKKTDTRLDWNFYVPEGADHIWYEFFVTVRIEIWSSSANFRFTSDDMSLAYKTPQNMSDEEILSRVIKVGKINLILFPAREFSNKANWIVGFIVDCGAIVLFCAMKYSFSQWEEKYTTKIEINVETREKKSKYFSFSFAQRNIVNFHRIEWGESETLIWSNFKAIKAKIDFRFRFFSLLTTDIKQRRADKSWKTTKKISRMSGVEVENLLD